MNVVVGIVVNAISEVTAENNVEEPETKEVSKEDLLKEMREVKEQMARLEKALEKTK